MAESAMVQSYAPDGSLIWVPRPKLPTGMHNPDGTFVAGARPAQDRWYDAIGEAGQAAGGAIFDFAGNIVDAAGNVLGLGGGGGNQVYDPASINTGAEYFTEGLDQAAFSYLEALDKSAREYQAGNIRDVAPIVEQGIRDIDIGPAAMYGASGPAAMERWQASGPAGIMGYDAAGPADVAGYEAALIGNTPEAQAAMVGETFMDPAAQAGFGGVQRAAFDRGHSDQVRDLQMEDVLRLRESAMGGGPSGAADTYAAALGTLADEQMGMVNQARGADKAAARQDAMVTLGRQGMIAAKEAAAMEAARMQAAQQQLTQSLGGVRTTDVDVSGQVAQLDAQANQLEAQLATAVAQGNRDAINSLTQAKAGIDAQRAQLQAQLGTQASTANMQTQAQQAQAQAQLQQQAAQQQAEAQNAAWRDYVARQDAAAAATATAGNTSSLDYARRLDAASQSGAEATNASSMDYARRLDEAARTNAGAANQQAQAQGQLTLQRDQAAGQQSIDAQRITNEQGVARDAAADAAQRQAFTATQDAQFGALNTANQATAAGTNAASGMSDAMKNQYEIALGQQRQSDTAAAADREGKRQLLTDLAGVLIPGR